MIGLSLVVKLTAKGVYVVCPFGVGVVDLHKTQAAEAGSLCRPVDIVIDKVYLHVVGVRKRELSPAVISEALLTIPMSSSSAVVQEIHIINTNERLKRKLDSFGIK